MMETSELPVLEQVPDEPPTGTCAEEAIDLAAFDLWQRASSPEVEDKGE